VAGHATPNVIRHPHYRWHLQWPPTPQRAKGCAELRLYGFIFSVNLYPLTILQSTPLNESSVPAREFVIPKPVRYLVPPGTEPSIQDIRFGFQSQPEGRVQKSSTALLVEKNTRSEVRNTQHLYACLNHLLDSDRPPPVEGTTPQFPLQGKYGNSPCEVGPRGPPASRCCLQCG
jgi:hypothetical protein